MVDPEPEVPEETPPVGRADVTLDYGGRRENYPGGGRRRGRVPPIVRPPPSPEEETPLEEIVKTTIDYDPPIPPDQSRIDRAPELPVAPHPQIPHMNPSQRREMLMAELLQEIIDDQPDMYWGF